MCAVGSAFARRTASAEGRRGEGRRERQQATRCGSSGPAPTRSGGPAWGGAPPNFTLGGEGRRERQQSRMGSARAKADA